MNLKSSSEREAAFLGEGLVTFGKNFHYGAYKHRHRGKKLRETASRPDSGVVDASTSPDLAAHCTSHMGLQGCASQF